MNAVANALEAQLSLVDWFKSIESLTALSSSRGVTRLSSSKALAAKTYASMANSSYQVDRKGLVIDRNV